PHEFIESGQGRQRPQDENGTSTRVGAEAAQQTHCFERKVHAEVHARHPQRQNQQQFPYDTD
ncbi:MAG: hypothetical protein ACPIOQ_66345, partial [Promethearchaeia archaeon]